MHIGFVRAVIVGTILLLMTAAMFGQVRMGVVITIAPPPLPIYDQPLCPGENYIWTPGYWAYGDDFDDYYWVPGTWVLAPEVGFLWTPGYWEWNEDRYVFYDGYWGPQVGFYGGIFYGFGYFGEGYEGGRWDHDRFFYNTTVNNVNITEIHNVYNAPVRTESTPPRVSYHGGNGGINRPPKPEELAAARARHIPPVPVQREHVQVARTHPDLRASANMGKPPVAATPKPGAIEERGVVPAKASGGPYTPPPNRGKNQARENLPRTVRTTVLQTTTVQTATLLGPTRLSMLATFLLLNVQVLQIQATRSKIRSTSSNKKSNSQSRNRKDRSSSKSRIGKTSEQPNRKPMTREDSRWSSAISSRRSNCSKSTSSSSGRWSRSSGHRRNRTNSHRRTGASLQTRSVFEQPGRAPRLFDGTFEGWRAPGRALLYAVPRENVRFD